MKDLTCMLDKVNFSTEKVGFCQRETRFFV